MKRPATSLSVFLVVSAGAIPRRLKPAPTEMTRPSWTTHFFTARSHAENSAIGFDESLLDDAAAAARTLSGFGKEIVGGRAVVSRYFVENPIERQLSIFVTSLTGRYCVLRAANRSGS